MVSFPAPSRIAEPASRAPHYVFPRLEAQYRANPDHLTDRVRRLMRAAGFFDTDNAISEEQGNASRGEVSRIRKTGLRKASVRDFHSFRVTWVPLEIVQKVTGHRTASIVMKHYFQPGREDFRRTLSGKMPALLVGGAPMIEPPNPQELLARLEAMTPETWIGIRNELIGRFGGTIPIQPDASVSAEVKSYR